MRLGISDRIHDQRAGAVLVEVSLRWKQLL